MPQFHLLSSGRFFSFVCVAYTSQIVRLCGLSLSDFDLTSVGMRIVRC